MATLAEIYNWFMTSKKPTQAQFWASWGSFWHKSEKIPISVIDGLTGVLNVKTENSQFESHKVAANAHQDLFDLKADKTDVELSQIKKMVTLYSGGAQEFTLPTFAQIIEVSINGKSTELYTQLNTETVRIDEYIEPVSQIVIIYLVDINLSAVPYYTQAQADVIVNGLQPKLIVGAGIAIINNVISSTAGSTTGEYTDEDLNFTPINNIISVTLISAVWVRSADIETVYLSFEIEPTAVGSSAFSFNIFNGNYPVNYTGPIGNGTATTYLNSIPVLVDIYSSESARVVLRTKDSNKHTGYITINYKKQ